MIEMKPCPFCGCKLETREEIWRVRGRNSKQTIFVHPGRGCTLDYKRIHSYVDRDVDAWNRRVSMPEEKNDED